VLQDEKSGRGYVGIIWQCGLMHVNTALLNKHFILSIYNVNMCFCYMSLEVHSYYLVII